MLKVQYTAKCDKCGEECHEERIQLPEERVGRGKNPNFICPPGWRERAVTKNGKTPKNRKDIHGLVHFCPTCKAPDER